jgi:hypothetical protein
MDKVTEFRDHARDCRRQAEFAANGASKEQWLKVAEQWERLAEQAERFPDAFQ